MTTEARVALILADFHKERADVYRRALLAVCELIHSNRAAIVKLARP